MAYPVATLDVALGNFHTRPKDETDTSKEHDKMATPENHPTFLDNANLRGANLVGAILERANLTGANLQNADLSRATLLGTNLYNANLAFAKLGSVNLAHLDCTGIDDIRAVLIAAGAKDMSPPDAGDASEPDAP